MTRIQWYQLCNKPLEYKKAVLNISNNQFSERYQLDEIFSYMPNELKDDSDVKGALEQQYLKLLTEKINNGYLGYYDSRGFVGIIRRNYNYFTAPFLDKCFEIINSNYNKFCYNNSKHIIPLLFKMSKFDQDKILLLLKNHKRVIRQEHIDEIFNHISEDKLNTNIKQTLTSLRFYRVKKLNSSNDQKDKIKLLKEFCYSPCHIKELKNPLDVTFEDLKALPPVGRFKLLKYYFQPQFYSIYLYEYSKRNNWYNRYGLDIFKRDAKNIKELVEYCRNVVCKNFKIEDISPEDLKPLLFTMAIYKNDKCTEWFDNYSKYYYVVHKENLSLEELSENVPKHYH